MLKVLTPAAVARRIVWSSSSGTSEAPQQPLAHPNCPTSRALSGWGCCACTEPQTGSWMESKASSVMLFWVWDITLNILHQMACSHRWIVQRLQHLKPQVDDSCPSIWRERSFIRDSKLILLIESFVTCMPWLLGLCSCQMLGRMSALGQHACGSLPLGFHRWRQTQRTRLPLSC